MDEAERLCDRVAIVDHGKVIALDTPAALIATLGAEHVIEFATDEGTAAFDDETLRRLQGVRSARVHSGTYQLQVSQLHLAVPALLTEVARRGQKLSELRTHSATLEDVFVSLTGRHLRDE
jgi:ABC-2 type transport system ATP-binding protein